MITDRKSGHDPSPPFLRVSREPKLKYNMKLAITDSTIITMFMIYPLFLLFKIFHLFLEIDCCII